MPDEAGPVLTDPTSNAEEAKRRYLSFLGGQRTPCDRRKLWAREDREFRGWTGLSRGERKVRNHFARLVANQVAPLDALQISLGTVLGPIPGFETREQFDAYWTMDYLDQVVQRWLRSPYFKSFAREQVKAAHNGMAAAAPKIQQALVSIALDEDAPKVARVSASKVLLQMVGIIAGTRVEEDVSDRKEELKKLGRQALKIVKSREAA